MEVQIGGRLEIALFPGVHVRFDDVHIRNREMAIASAEEAGLEIALLSMLHKEARIRRIGSETDLQ